MMRAARCTVACVCACMLRQEFELELNLNIEQQSALGSSYYEPIRSTTRPKYKCMQCF